MCGICGLAFPDSQKQPSLDLINSMCRTLIHRGPDDEGVYVDDRIALGARRLSIIDVKGGHQPLSSENKNIWVVQNGEIYNFLQLRKDLKNMGHSFKTRTDTEVIAHSYEEWGERCVDKFRGMFALAVWDKIQKTLFIARDRLGIKPLYYTLLPDKSLVFGSELKAILCHPGVIRRIDPLALDLFLTLEYIPAPYSIFKGIYKLPAAHSLTYQNGTIEIKRYWKVSPADRKNEKITKKDIENYSDQLYELLKEAVNLRLISDVPLGAFLSGGIDSSCIVGLMKELGASPIRTFSIGFEDRTYNETPHARRIVDRFETGHEEFIIRPDALDLTGKLIHHLDEPFGDFSIFPTYLVSKMARKHVTVILSGDGGDEIFGGYEHYQAQKFARLPFINWAAKPADALVSLFPPSPKKKGAWNKTQRFLQGMGHDPSLRHFRWMMFLSNESKQQFYTKSFLEESQGNEDLNQKKPFSSLFQDMQSYDQVNGELYLDLNTYLVDDILVKVDRMSMAASLETRVPLIDHKVVEFIFSLPGHLKLSKFTTKWLFKKTMERLLPKENIYRRKEGFSIPIKQWLRTDLKDLMFDHLNEKRISQEGYFNFLYIQRMIDLHLKEKANFSHQLWSLLVFEIWKDKYL
ncbi:MAG: asparagine synthase (glutamine-hydrolyzing) [Candidatus Aminicenantes bacterium]|nr:asparagine synthase (glutamine-hydrolyzing) [Candidatus Aminicenantes bacterium]